MINDDKDIIYAYLLCLFEINRRVDSGSIVIKLNPTKPGLGPTEHNLHSLLNLSATNVCKFSLDDKYCQSNNI